MKRRLPPLILLLFALTWTASAQHETLWERTAPFTHPDWFGSATERGMAYGLVDGQPRLFVASRSEAPATIRVLNAETGADVGTLSTTGVEGGYLDFTLNEVGVSEDGIIFASNMVLTASAENPFKVYRWEDESADPEVVIEYSAIGARFGDRMAVVGSAADNSLTIYVAASRSNQVVRFTTDDGGDTFTPEVITLEGLTDAGIQPNVGPVGLGDEYFYFNGSPWEGEGGLNPTLFEADGTLVGSISGDWEHTNTIRHFTLGERELVATFDGRNGEEQRVAFFDVTAGVENAVYVTHTPSLGTEPNLFMSGAFHVIPGEDESATVYVLAANNGIAAYTVDLSVPFAGTYYVGAEGTAPGGTDPHYATLGEAFAAINETVPTGPITLLITSDIDERGHDVVLNQPALTEDTRVTIRPAADVSPTITLGAISAEAGTDATNSGLSIDNTSWVTIDGSNEEGGTSRDLTFILEEGSGTRVLSVVRDAHDVTIRNSVILHEVYRAGGEGVRVRRAEDTSNEWVPRGVRIENNQIGSPAVAIKDGIGLFGTGTPLIRVGPTTVVNNTIYGGHRGITTFYVEEQTYSGNTIYLTGVEATPAWYAGVYLAGGENVSIEANEMHLLGANVDAPRYVAGVNNNLNSGEINIVNNMIRAGADFDDRDGEPGSHVYGIVTHREGSGETYNVYHNTIALGDTGQEGRHAAIGWESSGLFERTGNASSIWNVINNILIVDRDAANAFVIDWPVASEGGIDSDYNDLFASGDASAVGSWRGAAAETLAAWQFSSGLDENSVSKAVEFVSDTDLRLTGASLGDRDLAGTPLAAVTVDIDGTPRDEQWPYMGAYEGAEWLPIEDDRVAELPESFELHQNYPNPFNPSTTISYTLQSSGNVTVQVFNAAGQLVRQLYDGYQTQGRHEVRFDAGELASGVYLYRVQFDGHAQTKQMVLVK